jgi:hypothetical protein
MQHEVATASVEVLVGSVYQDEVRTGPMCGPCLGMVFRHELQEHVLELTAAQVSQGDLGGLRTRRAWSDILAYTPSQWAELLGDSTTLGEAFAQVLHRHRELYDRLLVEEGHTIAYQDADSTISVAPVTESSPEYGPVASMRYRHAIVEFARQQVGEDESLGWQRLAEWPAQMWAQLFAAGHEPANEQEAYARAGFAAGALQYLALGSGAARG